MPGIKPGMTVERFVAGMTAERPYVLRARRTAVWD
jgi:hypothetical protein